MGSPLVVCWISDFGIEWLSGVPEPISELPRLHPMSWQQVLLSELTGRPELKLHVIILRKEIPQDLSFELSGTSFHLIKTIGGCRAPSLFWTDTISIRKKLLQVKPQVVHAWGTERGAGLVASRLRLPFLITVQGLLSWYSRVIPLHPLERLSAFLEKISLPRSPLVTTESEFAVKFLEQNFERLNIRQIEHAPRQLFHDVRRRPQTSPLRFIFVGSFEYRKGADLLLHALDQLRAELNFELIIVGHGARELKGKLGNSVSEALWHRIQLKQALEPKQIADELAQATMMIFPTRADTSPNAVKEAVVAGVPVVASDVGGIPDYVIPGKNGVLFAPGKVEELVTAVRAACHHPLFCRGVVDAGSLQRSRDYLSPRLMGQKFIAAYQDLAAGFLK